VAAAAMAAFKVIAILLFSGGVWAAFRLLGGQGTYLRTLTAYIYMVSPLYLALVVLSLIGSGFLRAYDPALGLQLRADPMLFVHQPETFARFQADAPALAMAMTVVNYLTSAILIGWFVICLGAFRTVHGVARWHSAIAGFLIALLWWPFAGVILFLSVGIFGSLAPPLQ
jgi:hypothetical protein